MSTPRELRCPACGGITYHHQNCPVDLGTIEPEDDHAAAAQKVSKTPSIASAVPVANGLEEEKFLIWSIEHGAWWREGSNGYTKRRAWAGEYTLEQAHEICYGANQHSGEKPHEAMIPILPQLNQPQKPQTK